MYPALVYVYIGQTSERYTATGASYTVTFLADISISWRSVHDNRETDPPAFFEISMLPNGIEPQDNEPRKRQVVHGHIKTMTDM